ncbi:MAG: SHOCT domain-containing protein [Caldisericota bacterium]|nr:SHOCT domain-containing protein [Caldisericota bacterium]
MMRFVGRTPFGADCGIGSVFMIVGGILWGLFVLALVILVVRMLIRGSRCGFHQHGMMQHPEQSSEDEALQLLRRRYAAGEISKEEYDERRTTLSIK